MDALACGIFLIIIYSVIYSFIHSVSEKTKEETNKLMIYRFYQDHDWLFYDAFQQIHPVSISSSDNEEGILKKKNHNLVLAKWNRRICSSDGITRQPLTFKEYKSLCKESEWLIGYGEDNPFIKYCLTDITDYHNIQERIELSKKYPEANIDIYSGIKWFHRYYVSGSALSSWSVRDWFEWTQEMDRNKSVEIAEES